MARKFNVRRALELYEQHQEVRTQEGLTTFDPDTEPLKSELLSGKFTVLVSCRHNFKTRKIAIFGMQMCNELICKTEK